MIEISPSIIAADYAHLGAALEKIEKGGADMVHVDVMDGHFVPNITIGPGVAASLARSTRLPLDCHLMVEDPGRWIGPFLEAGAARISIHAEARGPLRGVLASIREGGAEASLAVNPDTPCEAALEVLDLLDVVLVMSVHPGFCGQAFIEQSVEKVGTLAAGIRAAGRTLKIQVDGGVDESNAERLVRAGARSLVAGSAVFRAENPAAAVEALRMAGAAAL